MHAFTVSQIRDYERRGAARERFARTASRAACQSCGDSPTHSFANPDRFIDPMTSPEVQP
jgi:hypothetical protein